MKNICEKCGKEHDGSYGSGRFCSKRCACQYASMYVDYKKNALSHKGKTQNHTKQRFPYGTWKCPYCNKILDTKRLLQIHKHEYHQQIDKNGKRITWNKGLTKETDERVKHNAKAVSIAMKKGIANGSIINRCTSIYWTAEKRKAQSEEKKRLYAEHPEKHPNCKLAGNRKQMTYPEQIAFDWLSTSNIEFEHQKEFCFDGIKRFVDFYIPSKKMFIEIDGEYWHPEGNDRDKQKDEIALKNGYMTIRIRPKKSVVKQLEKIFEE